MIATIFAAFKIDSIEVALNISQVKEVINFPDKINKMPLSPKFLIGVFNLRGEIIPLINLDCLLNIPSRDENQMANKKVVVSELDHALIGFIVDETTEILRIQENSLNLISYNNSDSDKIIAGIIELDHGNRMIQVMNPHALLRIQNIPQIMAKQKQHPFKKALQQEHSAKCISFKVGQLALAIEISKIFEIIKVPDIQNSPINCDICLGVINLRGISVPIVNFEYLFNENQHSESTSEKNEQRILILKNQHSLIGLLVDQVYSISYYSKKEIIVIPKITHTKHIENQHIGYDAIEGCVILNETAETFLLDTEKILDNHQIQKITDNHQQFYKNHQFIQQKKKFNREVYISFFIDQLYALPITDIQEIISYTTQLIKPPEKSLIIEGMINLRGKLVTIVNTNTLYQIQSQKGIDHKDKKIIILKNSEELCGLVVDNIDSIVTINSEDKLKLPTLMTQNLKEKFSDDIKEVISIEDPNKQKKALVILSIEPILNRIKFNMAA